jgi:hypothetical protein
MSSGSFRLRQERKELHLDECVTWRVARKSDISLPRINTQSIEGHYVERKTQRSGDDRGVKAVGSRSNGASFSRALPSTDDFSEHKRDDLGRVLLTCPLRTVLADHRVRADEIPMGRNGAVGQEGDAARVGTLQTSMGRLIYGDERGTGASR